MSKKNKQSEVPATTDNAVTTESGAEVPVDASTADGIAPAGDDADQLAKALEAEELDAKRPLCQPCRREDLRNLATYRVTRLNNTDELCCDRHVGPGSQYLKATPL